MNNRLGISFILRRMLLVLFALHTSASYAQYKLCKEYYKAENNSSSRQLHSVSYYDQHQNITRKVSIANDGLSGVDTTDYAYNNNLLVKKNHYWIKRIEHRPLEIILKHIETHPDLLGQPLHDIIKRPVSDTDMVRYYYNKKGLLIKKEKAWFTDNNTLAGRYYNTGKLKDLATTDASMSRTWKNHEVTTYIYNENNKLIEASGYLDGESFGEYTEYSESAKKIFYNSKNEIVKDSVVSYNGNKFDGSVSTYDYFFGGYEVLRANFSTSSDTPRYTRLVFKFNDKGKIIEEATYSLKSATDKIDNANVRFGRKNTYDYDSLGRLSKKSSFYHSPNAPDDTYYYAYE